MNIESPKDAEGREIPLDTRRLYDENGEKKTVLWFEYSPTLKHWTVVPDEGLNVATCASSVSHFYLTPPDSWEKLEEDLSKIVNHPEKVVCAYFGRERKDCDGCKLENCEGSCSHACLEDIITRIHELRGEN